MLRDSFGRTIDYIRLAVTSNCSSRCIYCRSAEPPPAGPELSPAEIESLLKRLVTHHGVKKVRLTGGEPTARPDLPEIIRRSSAAGVHDLAMTTNGLTLARMSREYRSAGLRRVNVALDTLDPEKYQRITGVDGLSQVLAGIDAAVAAGLTPVKLNTVVMRGQNDYELGDMLLFAAWKNLEIRFIELMPIGRAQRRWDQCFISEGEMRQRLAAMGICWVARPDTRDAARQYTAGLSYGRSARVGFITSMTCPFCDKCNRLSIHADGGLAPCLMDDKRGSILPALRPKFDANALDAILSAALAEKAQEPARQPQSGATT